MPTRPQVKTLSGNSVDILNAIRNSATQNYKDYIPVATKDAESIRKIGAIIMDYPALQNEFLSALVNRIGRVLITSKMYSNPIEMFKKGMLEFGETVEEIFVNIAKPFQFDPSIAEKEVFKREIPDVRGAFHVMNYQKFYKATISDRELKQAFLSWDGVSNLIAKIVDSMYTGANYDEFLTMKYLLARHILDGHMTVQEIPAVTTANMKAITAEIKGVSNKLTFMSSDNNIAGVQTFSLKENQYLIMNAQFDATMDVEVLASAFNMNKAEFMGHRVMIDGFGNLDITRLNILFSDDPNYTEIGTADLEALNAIPAVIIDADWFMVFDNLQEFTEQFNGQGLYWNYWYHVWKTFSVSPFANTALFVAGTPTVKSVKVNPSAASASVGQSLQLTATVTTENFAPQSVTWSSDSDKATVDVRGKVTLLEGATGTINITATSVYDSSKSGTCIITVA
jgi:uncharacterized protein YjdB